MNVDGQIPFTFLEQHTHIVSPLPFFNLQLPMQSVPITTDVVSSNLDQGKVYNIM